MVGEMMMCAQMGIQNMGVQAVEGQALGVQALCVQVMGIQGAGIPGTAIQVPGAFMAVLSFGLVLDLPQKYLGWSGITGGVCWLVYILVKAGSGSLVFGAFMSGLAVALMSHVLARILRAPVTVILIPGILPLVPGTSIYNWVYHIIRSSREQSMYYLIETIQIAGAIAMAVFLMDSMFKMVGNRKKV